MSSINLKDKANLIWAVADLLRGDYKQADYGKVILPLTIIRRLDCVLESTKQTVLDYLPKIDSMELQNADRVLNQKSGYNFHNRSKYDFPSLIADPNNLASNLRNYINGFSNNAREIIEYFNFDEQITRLNQADLLYQVVKHFQEFDLHPTTVSNIEMGYLFEELIRKFAEISNETAGEHFTPREVIKLMVNLIFTGDGDILTKDGIVKTLYDPACGTGGMLSVAEEYLHELNPNARLELFGQELNPESYAICKSDMLIKGQNADHIKIGNSFTQDQLEEEKFDYILSNPPFGVEWKKVETFIKKEYEGLGYAGRFGAGLPRISDGSLLFLQHMISKMKQAQKGGSRLAIVFNGSPLFTGSADSGESNIRKWIIENDMLESIIALPDQLFYNTGISTYIWVLDTDKNPARKGKIQLINAVSFFEKMSKSLGNKRHEISPAQIQQIAQIYGSNQESEYSKIYPNNFFGYSRITVERPLKKKLTITKSFLESIFSSYLGETAPQAVYKALTFDFTGKFDADCEKKAFLVFHTLIDLTFNRKQDLIDKLLEKYEYFDFCKRSELKIEKIEKLVNQLFELSGDISEDGEIILKNNKVVANSTLRDYENIPLSEDIETYFKREVLPHVPDAWIDESKTKVGYEINFTKYFYKYKPLRSLQDIRADILALEAETEGVLKEILE